MKRMKELDRNKEGKDRGEKREGRKEGSLKTIA